MKYTGQELFMEKLKQMIYNDDNPLITNHSSILSQRPQLQLLYEELGSVIQTLHLIDEQYHELQQVTDLKKRFKDAAEDAHDVVDLFVSNANLGNQISLNLEDSMTSIKSVKEEFMNMINNDIKMDSSPREDRHKTEPVATRTSCTRNFPGTERGLDAIVVGFDRHAELIRDKLVEDQKQLDVISIVGMGGLGKTTLATKVFNDPFVMYHFHVRGWITVSQTFKKQDLLKQILESIGNKIDNANNHDYSQLRHLLRKKLMRKRYLIVIDDIWNPEAWDALKLSFPNDLVGSRILLTSRLKEVALHANSQGFIYQLEYLTEDESWELLCKKVFHGSNVCPNQLVKTGMKIARNCHGLPLTLVVVAGVLAKEPLRKESWERIGRSVSSYIVSNEIGSIETLAWSFDHLRGHLRDCYLYLGGFPEDHMFRVQRLIWLWMAEGFIQEDGIRSLEEIAEDHVIELVDRNLVVVADRKSHGGIKSFYVHDILRELCFKIAKKENFYLKAQHTTRSLETYKQRRIFIEDNINIMNAPQIRSLLCFSKLDGTRKFISDWSQFWMLLMVLDLQCWPVDCIPKKIPLLFHLRYLAISYNGYENFPSSIFKLWSLQTLIIKNKGLRVLVLPKGISNLVNLRHLMCEGRLYILFPTIEKPMNLHTISRVKLDDGVESWVKCFPAIKKLSCYIQRHKECDFESLTSLERLKVSRHVPLRSQLKFTRFPPSLKSLTLQYLFLSWSKMSIIQALPNLQVLELLNNGFMGPKWDVGEEQFNQLKFLKLYWLDIKEWEASSDNFPCLKQLVVERCHGLKEIPPDFGNIPTLELIRISYCKDSVVKSLDTIQDEQHAQGNFDLKIIKKKL